MAEAENHVSMLPQPKRSAIFGALSEISSSDTNLRNGMTGPSVGHKRHGSNLPEPAPKRKTLVERAGEVVRPALAPPRSKTPGPQQPSNAFETYRAASTMSASTYRTNTSSSRNTPASSLSNSTNTGIRPPSRSISSLARPKTALAKEKAKTADTKTVPNTANLEGTVADEATKMKRMAPLATTSLQKNFAQNSCRTYFKGPRKVASLVSVRKPGVLALPATKRDLSIASRLKALSLETCNLKKAPENPPSPSRLPRPATPPIATLPSPIALTKSRSKSPSKFLTRWGNIEALDADEHYTNFKRMFEDYQVLYKQTLGEVHEAKNANSHYTSHIEKLEQEQLSKTDRIIVLTSENETLKYRLEAAEKTLTQQIQNHEQRLEELRVQFKQDVEIQRQELKDHTEQLKMEHRDELRTTALKYEKELEDERGQRINALSQVSTQGALEKQKQQIELDMKDHEITLAKAEAVRVAESLEREKIISDDLRKHLADAGSSASNLEATRQALQAKIEFLESDCKSQSEAYADMERRMNEAFIEAEHSKEKLRKEETLRRKLHNQVQELKGNIRVFCRVRPTLPTEEPEELAQMNFPEVDEEANEIEVRGPEEKSSLGKVTTRTHPFTFDRVFNPRANNTEIFAEISQLIQSALDGFNVCIFAYGQTGSGKTYTMSSDDGMIPRALRQIYSTSKELEERGWKYTMEGSFVEVYNEEIRDLLGKDGSDNTKHEIRHDMQRCETTISDVVTISLDSQEQVEGILEQAMNKRSVAATKANERSSRSHSVFILKLVGHNTITGEKSKGTLNLVDLAGSERLSHSKVEGQRLKETQSINKSLSCLGDVIGALGQQGSSLSAFDPRSSVNGGGSSSWSSSTTSASTSAASGGSASVASHIPYRNSKLTYLLQFSLGGNSKTLMFVMVAPEKKCLGETLTSLKFADKVARTRVGVARKVR